MHRFQTPAASKPRAVPLLSLTAASAAALAAPTAAAAPGDPLGPPMPLANDVSSLSLGRASNGRIVTAYLRSGTLMARRYDADGSALGSATPVAAISGFGGLGRVSVDADGDFVIAWADLPDRRARIRAQRFDRDGHASGALIEVGSLPVAGVQLANLVSVERSLFGLAVDMNDDGDFAVLWNDYLSTEAGNRFACKYLIGAPCTSSGSESLLLRRYDRSGAPQGPAQIVASATVRDVRVGGIGGLYSGRNISGADVAVPPGGGAVVAWTTQTQVGRITRGHLYTRSYGPSGLAGLPREVGTPADIYRADVRIDAASNGRLALVHRTVEQNPGTFSVDCGVRFDLLAADGSPVALGRRVDDTVDASNCLSSPVVSLSADGRAVVGYAEDGRLRGQRYGSGGVAVGGLFDLSLGNESRTGPQLASDAAGNFALAYATVNANRNLDFRLRLFEGP